MKILEYIPNHDDKQKFDLIIIERNGKIETYRQWNESSNYPYLIKKLDKHKKELYMEGGIITINKSNPTKFDVTGSMYTDIMITCNDCGNKRCPKATNKRMLCTNSNEPNQEGIINMSYSKADEGERENPYKELDKIINHFANTSYDTELDKIYISMMDAPLGITVEHTVEGAYDIEVQNFDTDKMSEYDIPLDMNILERQLKTIVDMSNFKKKSK